MREWHGFPIEWRASQSGGVLAQASVGPAARRFESQISVTESVSQDT